MHTLRNLIPLCTAIRCYFANQWFSKIYQEKLLMLWTSNRGVVERESLCHPDRTSVWIALVIVLSSSVFETAFAILVAMTDPCWTCLNTCLAKFLLNSADQSLNYSPYPLFKDLYNKVRPFLRLSKLCKRNFCWNLLGPIQDKGSFKRFVLSVQEKFSRLNTRSQPSFILNIEV